MKPSMFASPVVNPLNGDRFMLVVCTKGRFDGAYSKFLVVTSRLPRCFARGLVAMGWGVSIFTAFAKSKLSTRYDPLCANADNAESTTTESARGKFFIRETGCLFQIKIKGKLVRLLAGKYHVTHGLN